MAEDETLAKHCPACGGPLQRVQTRLELHRHFVCVRCRQPFFQFGSAIQRCDYPELHILVVGQAFLPVKG